MTDMITNQRDFMYLGNQTTSIYNEEQIALYNRLVQEEFLELMLTTSEDEIIKEACDVLVVTLGLLLSMGIDVHKAWELVHKNNISKVLNQDVILKNVIGKIQKSPESIKRKAEMMKGIKELLRGNLNETSTR